VPVEARGLNFIINQFTPAGTTMTSWSLSQQHSRF